MADPPPMSGARHDARPSPPESLVDVLDNLLDTGVVADAQLVIAVAGVDLIFVGLRALLASMDTAGRVRLAPPAANSSAAGNAS
jgi:hypothetical protein